MADQQDKSHDIRANEQTYGGFISLLKWAIPLTALLAFVVIIAIQ